MAKSSRLRGEVPKGTPVGSKWPVGGIWPPCLPEWVLFRGVICVCANPAKQFERWAAAAVGEWVGNSGELLDTGLGSGLDFEIRYHDGRIGVGEVGTALDPNRQEQWARVLKEPDPQLRALPLGFGSWSAGLHDDANIGTFLQQVTSVIERMLAADRVHLEVRDDWPRPGMDSLVDAARCAGIRYLARVADSEPSHCMYFLEGIGGVVPTDPEEVVAWLDRFLEEPRNRDYQEKLASRFDVNERHLVLLVGESAGFGVCQLLSRGTRLPKARARGLDIATHIWLTSRYSASDGPLMWLASHDGWTALRVGTR